MGRKQCIETGVGYKKGRMFNGKQSSGRDDGEDYLEEQFRMMPLNDRLNGYGRNALLTSQTLRRMVRRAGRAALLTARGKQTRGERKKRRRRRRRGEGSKRMDPCIARDRLRGEGEGS